MYKRNGAKIEGSSQGMLLGWWASQEHFARHGAETDAVQAILARYLQRRLQGSQLSTPPPPAVLFSSNNQARVRQAAQRTPGNMLPRNVSEKEKRDHVENYDDYEDDLEGFEDSERSRTRFDLFAGTDDGSIAIRGGFTELKIPVARGPSPKASSVYDSTIPRHADGAMVIQSGGLASETNSDGRSATVESD
ncbi:hypothetical protein WN55_02811 [Dufourea novaeangliae]|uniref:Uncharacterized protein n=1 Tax=Dufourea novaeangliae TaxID=178035 RepID=A0A154PHU2_DUFNO|nr:hypothetical protein WN55_02811 [Dufourea novaeangliae]